MKSLILPFLFCWLFIGNRASKSTPPEKSTQPSQSDSLIFETTEEYPYFLQDRYIEANFFQDFLNAPIVLPKKDFLNYVKYYFITVEGRKEFIQNYKLDLQIIARLRGSGALDTSIRRVSYLMLSGVQPELPEYSIEDCIRNPALFDHYVIYFFNTIEAVFKTPLPASPDYHKLLFEKREVFFRGTYHTWVAVFRYKERALALSLGDQLKIFAKNIIRDNENKDVLDFSKEKQMTIRFQFPELQDIVNQKVEPQVHNFLLYPLLDFAKYDSSLKGNLLVIYTSLSEIFSTLKGNHAMLEDDLAEFNSFKKDITRLKLFKGPKESKQVELIKESVNEQLDSLLGPLQKYLLPLEKPKSFYHLAVQLLHENRFLDRMTKTSTYPFHFVSILRDSHNHRIKSVLALVTYMDKFQRGSGNWGLLLKFLEKIPKFTKTTATTPAFSVDVYDPKDFLPKILKLGIPEGAILSFPTISPSLDVQIIYDNVNILLSSFAYYVFSSIVFLASKPDATPLFQEGADRNADIAKFLGARFRNQKNFALQTLSLVQSPQEKKLIAQFSEMAEAWILSKCHYFFHESDPKVAIEKTGHIFPLPVRTLSLDEWVSLEFTLYQNSTDPGWKAMQLTYLGHLEIIFNYIKKNRTD
jgi:hypothetical protein